MTPSDWARAHLGESIIRSAGSEWTVMDTDTGIVFGRRSMNIAVDVTDEGWWVRLYAVTPASRYMVAEWQMPAIHVPQGFLTLIDQLSWNA